MREMRITTMHDLCSLAKGRRVELGLTQADLAARTGTSRAWVNSFENGKRTVELSLVLRVLDALDIGLEAVDAAAQAGRDGAVPSLDEILDEYLKP